MHLLEEVEVVAVKVETQKEFLERHASFFSSCELPPDLIGVDLSNHIPKTFLVLQIYSCDLHEPGRTLKRAQRWACITQSTTSMTILSTALLTFWGMLRFSKLYSRVPCLSNLSSRAKLLCGGGGRNVVVVIAMVVDVDVNVDVRSGA
ncbi:hypothetical protein Tco_1181193 [Tanacetum coccineum]